MLMSSTVSTRCEPGQHLVAAFRPQDHQGADDEGQRHRHRREQMGLDRLAEQEAQRRRRQESDDQVDGELLLARVRRQTRQHSGDARAVFPHHGQDGAGLDRDLEHLHLLP
jgi:hypothetical protein